LCAGSTAFWHARGISKGAGPVAASEDGPLIGFVNLLILPSLLLLLSQGQALQMHVHAHVRNSS
jgi:hypothetical protein